MPCRMLNIYHKLDKALIQLDFFIVNSWQVGKTNL